MKIATHLMPSLAKWMLKKQKHWKNDPVSCQKKTLALLIEQAKDTEFGQHHHYREINSYEEFKQSVKVVDYEDLKPYVEKVLDGRSNVLWKGKPLYLAKTSGTTSGSKFIPITHESLPNHILSARNSLLSYVAETNNTDFIFGKKIFLSGSPTLEKQNGIQIGRLSGIVNHHVPFYIRSSQLPAYTTNMIDDWEEKVDSIVEETYTTDMRLISGIPAWLQMYFDRLILKTGKPIKDIFPNFSLLLHGGVNFEPYRAKLVDMIGAPVDTIETYPASEGFFAYQDSQKEEGLLLQVHSGIFYEFIPASEYFSENPPRLSVENVELGVNYALVISSNAGLWGYAIGDTIKFVSIHPPKIIVTGRIKHFLSAFGEHVIGEEVDKAMATTLKAFPETKIVEFTVAPQVQTDNGLPYHEWLIAFSSPPTNMKEFKYYLDTTLRTLNTYYDDLISGNVLRELEITSLAPDAFIRYMKSIGKLGGQNKVPRLSNDRGIANELTSYHIK